MKNRSINTALIVFAVLVQITTSAWLYNKGKVAEKCPHKSIQTVEHYNLSKQDFLVQGDYGNGVHWLIASSGKDEAGEQTYIYSEYSIDKGPSQNPASLYHTEAVLFAKYLYKNGYGYSLTPR